jgi:hypothetical protein
MKDHFKVRYYRLLTVLLDEITTWNIFHQYLIYKPEAPDENSEYFHLINLEKNNATYLIEDITNNDPSCK